MTDKEPYQSLELRDLETKLDQFIDLYDSVKNENETLKSKQDDLVREKAYLLEKTTIARNRVEAMISRLKAMGQS
ncbi:TIGR02449 family protein [Methyloglobulus sp.]|uniref:TIGR02449 family protein n=1 Tax=Methyloglobulus sp. TaxID=2518622 RepID=UPI0032B784F2